MVGVENIEVGVAQREGVRQRGRFRWFLGGVERLDELSLGFGGAACEVLEWGGFGAGGSGGPSTRRFF